MFIPEKRLQEYGNESFFSLVRSGMMETSQRGEVTMRSSVLRILSEIVLWVVANVVCVAVPTALVYFVAMNFLGTGYHMASLYALGFGLASLTWGSWAALTWTRTRFLRVGMRGSTAIPGLIFAGIGVLIAKSGLGLVPGVVMIGAGLGGVVISTLLSKSMGAKAARHMGAGLLAGLVAFPIVSSVLALSVGSLWMRFISVTVGDALFGGCVGPSFHTIAGLFNMQTLMATVMLWTLVATIIPAVSSTLSQRICQRFGF